VPLGDPLAGNSANYIDQFIDRDKLIGAQIEGLAVLRSHNAN
jgi:hypothetical protein